MRSHVMFDFDGTLSWLRHGWPELMLELFGPYFPIHPGETAENVRKLLLTEILSLNGKPTIYQMMQFCDAVQQRGGRCPSPEELLHEYQTRLDVEIAKRSQQIVNGHSAPDDFIIFGARGFLERLHQRKLVLIILSGTIEHRVKEEAGWLGLSRFFGKHIYGSTPDHKQFSKRQVIDRILHEENIDGSRLLSFGDGPVEIAETKAVGGFAVGVASDENQNGSNKIDEVKKHVLLEAGADAIIADYRETDWLEKLLEQ